MPVGYAAVEALAGRIDKLFIASAPTDGGWDWNSPSYVLEQGQPILALRADVDAPVVVPELFRCIAQIPTLRYLGVGEGCAVDDARASSLAGLTNLTEILIEDGLGLTAIGLAKLATMPALVQLQLERCPRLRPTDLDAVRGAPALRGVTLGLYTCGSDEALLRLADISSITRIGVEWSDKVTDKGLEKLAEARNDLRRLHVSSCDNVTQVGIAAVLKAMPDIELSTETREIAEWRCGDWVIERISTKDSSSYFESDCRYRYEVAHRRSGKVLASFWREEFGNASGWSYSGLLSLRFSDDATAAIAEHDDGRIERIELPD